MPKVNNRLKRFSNLRWSSSPSKLLPHGLHGIISVLLGLYLIFFHALRGDLEPYLLSSSQNFWINVQQLKVICYAVSTAFNAIGGYKIVGYSELSTQSIFRRCAVLQLCLVYYVIRFLPIFTEVLQQIESLKGSEFLNSVVTLVPVVMRYADICFMAVLVAITLSFLSVASNTASDSLVLANAVGIGTFGILLLSTYPVQLAIYGQEWLECVYVRYPMQGAGMVAFIYVPATVVFSLILFGATLYQRRIISAIEFGLISFAAVAFCLIATVLSQEAHIPYVSTQRIYMPCEEPSNGTFQYQMVHLLDFSQYARKILTSLFNMKFHNEENNIF